jgi:hypothetical protein
MSHHRMSASSVAHKSTGGTLQSLPEPVDPVGNAPDYLTFKTVAPLRQRVPISGDTAVSSSSFGSIGSIRFRPGRD